MTILGIFRRPTHASRTLLAFATKRRLRLLVVRADGDRLVRRPGDPAFTLRATRPGAWAGQGWTALLDPSGLWVRPDGARDGRLLIAYTR